MTHIYDDPRLLNDPDYTTARCGAVVHIDDLADHGKSSDPCELCDDRRRRQSVRPTSDGSAS